MAQNKTVATDATVGDFIEALEDRRIREDSRQLLVLMQQITGHEARMWGGSMVGFGNYHYRYESGREGDFFLTGFAPRKSALSVYIMPGFERFRSQLGKLGPHKTGKSCLYLKNLDSIDRDVLAEIIRDSVAYMRANYDCS